MLLPFQHSHFAPSVNCLWLTSNGKGAPIDMVSMRQEMPEMLTAVSSHTPGVSCCLGDIQDSSRGSLGVCTVKHATQWTRTYGRNSRMDRRHRITTCDETCGFLLLKVLGAAPMTGSTATSRISVPAAMISYMKVWARHHHLHCPAR